MAASLQEVGPRQWQRYRIVDEEQKRFWSGSEWVVEPERAQLFAKLRVAAEECRRIRTEQNAATRVVYFQTTVVLAIRTSQHWNPADLGIYMCQHSDLQLDAAAASSQDPGIIDAAVIWGSLKQIEPPESGDTERK